MTEWGGDVGDKYDTFRKHLRARGFKSVGYGSFREGYQRGKVVIKVPLNGDGELDNKIEAACYRKYKSKPTSNGIVLAPCRLLSNGCLMMMAVVQVLHCPVEPAWAVELDGYQVGKYRERFVAYDYAADLIADRRRLEKKWKVKGEWFNKHYNEE